MTSTTVTYQGMKFVVESYVDPCPGLGARDRVEWVEDCNRCGGSGVYRWVNAMGNCEGSCFGCWGTGKVERSQAAQTLRKIAREDALHREHGDAIAEYHANIARENIAREQAAELAEAWDAAHAEQARRAAMNNGTVGEVGERLRNLDAEVVVSAGFERDKFNGYGTEYVKLVIFKLADGRVLKASGTGMSLYGLDRGDKVRVTGTVKDFGEYKGQVQTILQRVKVEPLD
ncbi:DNA binding protein [Mycobacterium phage Ellie]|uniref:DNA binding protein n=1 Tax=Mycobacterium phage Ellie TaxID=2762405 RepID=A0A7G8LM44_9CAUD|nr:DNA binding protein [Mycobacterium phage Ellie]QNJ58316.1 DNA binding protein [Mycobacterium phage Ellie]